jgi:hypothetical protein
VPGQILNGLFLPGCILGPQKFYIAWGTMNLKKFFPISVWLHWVSFTQSRLDIKSYNILLIWGESIIDMILSPYSPNELYIG